MKRTLITPTGTVPFIGGATTYGVLSLPKPPVNPDKDLYFHILRQTKVSSFLKSR